MKIRVKSLFHDETMHLTRAGYGVSLLPTSVKRVWKERPVPNAIASCLAFSRMAIKQGDRDRDAPMFELTALAESSTMQILVRLI